MKRGRVDDHRLAELMKLGVSRDEAQAWLDAQEPEDEAADAPLQIDDGPLIVWPENRPVVRLFMQLQTQWRKRPSGALDGLRYEAARTVIEVQRLKRPRRLFGQLVEMEHAAVEAWNGT